jgi:hypothetical protein
VVNKNKKVVNKNKKVVNKNKKVVNKNKKVVNKNKKVVNKNKKVVNKNKKVVNKNKKVVNKNKKVVNKNKKVVNKNKKVVNKNKKVVNKKEFGHLIKCLCLIIWKIDRVDASVEIKDKEKLLENEIKKLNVPNNKKIKENSLGIVALHLIRKIRRKALELEESKKLCAKPSYFGNIKIQNFIIHTCFQSCKIYSFGHGCFISTTWAITNNLLCFLFLEMKSLNASFDPIIQRRNKIFGHDGQMDIIFHESKKAFLSWLCFWMGYYFLGNTYFENLFHIIFNFILGVPVVLIFGKVINATLTLIGINSQ